MSARNLPDGIVDVRKLTTAFGEGGAHLTFVVAYNGAIEAGSERYETIRTYASALKPPDSMGHSVMLLPVAPREPAAHPAESRDPAPPAKKPAPKKRTIKKQAKARATAPARQRARPRSKSPAKSQGKSRPQPRAKTRTKVRPKARAKSRPKPTARTGTRTRTKSARATRRTRKARR